MRRFLNHCFVSGVVFFLAFAALDFVISKSLSRLNVKPFNVWNEVMGGKVDADVVALGNSLVTLSFNTEYLDSTLGVKTYAMGFSGSQFDRQSYMYSLYRSRNRPPKVMVNFVDYNSMSLTRRVPDRPQFYPWFFDKDFRRVVFPVERFHLLERFLPMWRWRGYRPIDYTSRFSGHLKRGFKYITFTRSPFIMGDRGLMRFGSDSAAIAPLWEKYLSRNVSEGIRTVFVLPPLHESCQYADGHKERMVSTFRGYSERYGIPFLDYSDLPITADSTFFRDPYHLNGKGSEVFCDTLARDLKRLGL